MKEYDIVIVGAGSTGCVLASRLSQKRSRNVLLLDAGPYFRKADEFPDELLHAGSMGGMMPGHPNNWSFVGALTPDRTYPMPRGKVVGGSSAINGTYFIRARKADFDEWAGLGNDEWSYEKVLPYYIKSETDLDFGGDLHGTDGPMPIRRADDSEMRPASHAFVQACLDDGFPEDPDKNAESAGGVGRIPRNCLDGMRMNTAITYLAQCADRPNLTIEGDTFVRRVIFDGSRAVGVEAERHGELVTIRAGEVILSAGGIKSPHLLMLSGIGAADTLRRYGLSVVCDRPGVGQGVQDHPSVAVLYRIKNDTPLPPDLKPLQACLNYTAPGSPTASDLQISCSAGSLNRMMRRSDSGVAGRVPAYLLHPKSTLKGLRELPARFVMDQARARNDLLFLCSLDKERSRGEITLAAADPSVPPEIRLNYLSDPDDLRRMRVNVRTADRLLRSPEFVRLGIKRTSPSDEDMASDTTLDAWIARNLGTSFHTSCGARMGSASDPGSVVDQRGQVHGVEALRVLDISVSPSVVRRGPHATAVMIGERGAAFFD